MCTVADQTMVDCGWCPETSCGYHPINRKDNMGYDYKEERPKMFVLANQHRLMRLRDKAIELLALAGALDVSRLTHGMDMPSSSWERHALIEYMEELQLLEPIRDQGREEYEWTQYYQAGAALRHDVHKARSCRR